MSSTSNTNNTKYDTRLGEIAIIQGLVNNNLPDELIGVCMDFIGEIGLKPEIIESMEKVKQVKYRGKKKWYKVGNEGILCDKSTEPDEFYNMVDSEGFVYQEIETGENIYYCECCNKKFSYTTGLKTIYKHIFTKGHTKNNLRHRTEKEIKHNLKFKYLNRKVCRNEYDVIITRKPTNFSESYLFYMYEESNKLEKIDTRKSTLSLIRCLSSN